MKIRNQEQCFLPVHVACTPYYEEGLKDQDKKFLQRCFGSEFFNWCRDRFMSVRWYNVPKNIWMNYSSELAIMVQTV